MAIASTPTDWDIYADSDRLACPFISRILQDYESAGIMYCILRGYEELPEQHGNDLDILIDREDLDRARSLLETAAGSLGWCRMAYVRKYGYNGLYFAPPNHGGRWLLVDLFTQTHWRGLAYGSADYILAHRVEYKTFHVANPGAEAALLLVKELLPWGKVKSKNNARGRMQQCVKSNENDFLASLIPFFGKKTVHELLCRLQQGCWMDIEADAGSLRRRLVVRTLLRQPFKQTLIWFAFLWGHIRHRIRKPLGMFVVLVGPDGSGKTTIARGVAEAWRQTIPPGKKPEHIHGDFNILPRLRLLRTIWARLRGRPLPPEPDYTQKHAGAKARPHSLSKSLLYLAYYYWGYVLGHVKVHLVKSDDRLLIADRYFYDYFFQRGNMHLPHWLLRFLSYSVAQPDLIIFLDADSKVIYERKKELTIEEIERQRRIIKKLLTWLPNAVTVDTSDGIDATIAGVREAMIKKMSERS